MAPLSPTSARAVARLRAYRPPPSIYTSLPVSRRAAVLLLLFPDRQGALRVVLTLRSSTLSSYAGQVSLPGGKADLLPGPSGDATQEARCETPWQTARREASEEIGLPLPSAPPHRQLPAPFRIEHLCELPVHLALTEQGVRPCVALLHSGEEAAVAVASETSRAGGAAGSGAAGNVADGTGAIGNAADAEERLIPRLGEGEVAAVFSAPFERFLCTELGADEESRAAPEASGGLEPQEEGGAGTERGQKRVPWYRGRWSDWHDSSWRMHDFRMPRELAGGAAVKSASPQMGPVDAGRGQAAGQELVERGPLYDGSKPAPKPLPIPVQQEPFRIWGLTAAILVDAARTAYGRDPDFPYVKSVGEEDLIRRMLNMGRLPDKKEKGARITKEDLSKVGVKGKI